MNETLHQQLLARLHARSAIIGVIGLGYVGLPLAVSFAEAGYHVVCVDVSDAKVDAITRGDSYIPDVTSAALAAVVTDGRLRATTDYTALKAADAISICVPTPLRKTRDPDMSYVILAVEGMAAVVQPGTLVVLESTTYPGTTEELVVPKLAERGLTVGQDVFVAFSPERIDPGNARFGVRNTPKVIGGVTPACTEAATALYTPAVDQVVPVSSPTAAEMVKLLENTFRAVNIGLVNEMAIMCDRLNVDVWEVIGAAATKPFGFMPFYPGPGLGGHCIPVDPLYLSWKLKTLNYNARFIELASEVNTSMPRYVVEKVALALNEACKPVRGSRVVVLGVAYKRDVDDVRESPALDVIGLLRERGAEVSYHDPHVAHLHVEGHGTFASVPYTQALVAEADCVVAVTDHSAIDWAHVLDTAKVVVDTRNVSAGRPSRAQVWRL